ncbi:MAG: hypothetical protein K8S23_12005 [Candidatus Cloacimonetes bacterium]|nr:hypothetical protein [Candidatus Cloacimonadota bacterium]
MTFVNLWSEKNIITHFTIKDGLGTNSITKLFQDSQGYLWVGTNQGLYRYDGNEFKFIEAEKYRTKNLEEKKYSNNEITDIMEDKFHNIWIYSFGGINRSESGFLQIRNSGFLGCVKYKTSIISFDFEFDNENLYELQMMKDKKDRIWVSTPKELSFFDNMKKTLVWKPDSSFTNPVIFSLLDTGGGNIWLSNDRNIFFYNGITLSKNEQIELILNSEKKKIQMNNKISYWMYYKETKNLNLSIKNGSRLFFSTYWGIIILDGDKIELFDKFEDISLKKRICSFIDLKDENFLFIPY